MGESDSSVGGFALLSILVVFEAAGTATYVGQDEKPAVAIFPGGTVWWLNGLTI